MRRISCLVFLHALFFVAADARSQQDQAQKSFKTLFVEFTKMADEAAELFALKERPTIISLDLNPPGSAETRAMEYDKQLHWVILIDSYYLFNRSNDSKKALAAWSACHKWLGHLETVENKPAEVKRIEMERGKRCLYAAIGARSYATFSIEEMKENPENANKPIPSIEIIMQQVERWYRNYKE